MLPSREKIGINVDCFIERLLPSSCLCLLLVLVWMLPLVGSFSGLINKKAKLQNFPTLDGINEDETQILFVLSGWNLRLYIMTAIYYGIGPWNQVTDKPDAHTAGCQVSPPTTWLFRSAPSAPHCLLMCHVLASSYQICEEKGLWATL